MGSIDDIIEYNRDVHEGYKQDQRDHKKAMAKKKKRLKAISTKKNQIWLNAKTEARLKKVAVGRTIGAASGWGTLIAGASLLAQTKKAKKFRQDPTYRKAAIKKLFHTKNTFPIFTISPSVARFFEETGHKPSKKYPPKIRDPYWGKN